MIECCISLFKKYQEEKSYHMYITDALRAIAENTSRMYGGRELKHRWVDLIENESSNDESSVDVEDNRSCEAIANDIWNRIEKR